MDELRTLTELMAERCGLEPDYMGELLELYRRTANRIEAMEPMVAEMRERTDQLAASFKQLVDAAGAQAAEPQAAEPEAAKEKRVCTYTKPTGGGAKEKQEILARLQAARDDGVPLADIAEASGVTINDVIDVLNCNKVAMEKWRWIRAGLTKLDR